MGDQHVAQVKALLKKPLTETIWVVLDPDLAEEYETAQTDHRTAVLRAERDPKDTEAAIAVMEADQKVSELRRRLEEEQAVVRYRFRGIGRAHYQALLDQHPATAEQRMKAKASGMDTVAYNYETFPPALVAACLVDPELSVEDVQAMWDSPDWNEAELVRLSNAATKANGAPRTVELGKG